MRRKLTVWTALLIPLLLLFAPPASGETLTPASGSVTRTSLELTSARPVGSATLLTFVEKGVFTGTFDGTYVAIDTCLQFTSGDAMCEVDLTFKGTVAGVKGKVKQFVVGTFDLTQANPPAGRSDNYWVVTRGTGGLSGIGGYGTSSATLNPDGSYSGTYSGNIFLRR